MDVLAILGCFTFSRGRESLRGLGECCKVIIHSLCIIWHGVLGGQSDPGCLGFDPWWIGSPGLIVSPRTGAQDRCIHRSWPVYSPALYYNRGHRGHKDR
jgi:hypothetical protein